MQFDYVIRSSVYVSEEEISEIRQLMAEGMDFDQALDEAIEDGDRLYLVTEYVYDALKAEVLLGQVVNPFWLKFTNCSQFCNINVT